MIDHLNKYAGILPIIAIIVYLLGYISFVSYLQSYGIDENIGLDFSILRHGMLLSLIIGPVIFMCFADFKTDNYDNVDPAKSETLVHNLHDALGYSILYTIPLAFVFFGPTFDGPTLIMIGILLIGLLLNKIPMPPQLSKVLKGFFLISPLLMFTILSVSYPQTGKVSLYTMQLVIFFGCTTLRLFNKEHRIYQASKIGSVILAVVSGAGIFGSFVISDIPSKYGGELRPQTRYYLNGEKSLKLNIIEIREAVNKDNSLSLRKIYESNNRYYFLTPKNNVYALPIEYFDVSSSIPKAYIQTKKEYISR